MSHLTIATMNSVTILKDSGIEPLIAKDAASSCGSSVGGEEVDGRRDAGEKDLAHFQHSPDGTHSTPVPSRMAETPPNTTPISPQSWWSPLSMVRDSFLVLVVVGRFGGHFCA